MGITGQHPFSFQSFDFPVFSVILPLKLKAMKYCILVFSLLLGMMACKSGDNTSNDSVDPALIDQLTGMYSAILPCDGCPGIQFYLVLRDSFEFETSAKYIKRSDQLIQYFGKWSFQSDSILFLDKADPDMQYFKIEENRLRVLSASGEERDGPDANRYVLVRLKDEAPPTRDLVMLDAKRNKGYDFTAGSNSPVWSIDVDFDGFTRFKADTTALITPSPRLTASPNPEVKMYAIPTTIGELTMQIKEESCRDKQTGKEQQYSVTVQLHETVYTGCGTLLTEFVVDSADIN